MICRTKHPGSGRCLDIFTSAPGVVIYPAGILDVKGGKGGANYGTHSSFVIMTQNWPNAPNQVGTNQPHPVIHSNRKTTNYNIITKIANMIYNILTSKVLISNG